MPMLFATTANPATLASQDCPASPARRAQHNSPASPASPAYSHLILFYMSFMYIHMFLLVSEHVFYIVAHQRFRQGYSANALCIRKTSSSTQMNKKLLRKLSEKTCTVCGYSYPGRSSDKDNGLYTPTQLRLAHTRGAHEHETKTMTTLNRSGTSQEFP